MLEPRRPSHFDYSANNDIVMSCDFSQMETQTSDFWVSDILVDKSTMFKFTVTDSN